MSLQPASKPGDNPTAETRPALAAADLPGDHFEIYKIAVEMADRVSARRGIANSFFLTINTTALGILGIQGTGLYLAVAGLILCWSWWALLRSYRDLNQAKFEIILTMEQRLPARLFGDEWELLRKDPVHFAFNPTTLRSWLAQYRELGAIERVVPWVFALVYLADIVRQLTR